MLRREYFAFLQIKRKMFLDIKDNCDGSGLTTNENFIDCNPFGQRTRRGRCPIEQRGEFPSVRTSERTSVLPSRPQPPRPLDTRPRPQPPCSRPPAVHILGSQYVYSRAEGIADHFWPRAVLLYLFFSQNKDCPPPMQNPSHRLSFPYFKFQALHLALALASCLLL